MVVCHDCRTPQDRALGALGVKGKLYILCVSKSNSV